jgi:Tol biopolymer transport system component
MFTIRTHRFMTRLVLGLTVLLATLLPARPAEAGWRSLTGVLPPHTGIYAKKFSPDSRYVVFIADIEMDDRYELYSAPTTGTLPVKLNPPLVAGGDVYSFKITPDSRYVIYTAKQEAGDSDSDLYRAPIGGGPAVKLNIFYLSGRNVRDFKIDPDNVRVVYGAIQENDEISELFSVQIAGGMIVKLNPLLVAGGDVYGGFAIDPVTDRVVYLADQEVDNRVELYGVPITGGLAVHLNSPLSRVIDFEINPQGQGVVFRAQPNGSKSIHLFMNAPAGGLLTPLTLPLGPYQSVAGFHISPDGARVVYNVATGTPTNPYPAYGNLYSVPIGGGLSTPLTAPADPGYGAFYDNFIITPDGQRVVYAYQQNAMTSRVLESVSINGGSRATLHNEATGQRFNDPHLSPNGQRVVYGTYPSLQISAIPVAGGASVPLGVGFFAGITPDSSRVIFDNYDSSPFDLYSVLISGGEARNLSRTDNQVGVADSIISPDSRWIVFEVYYPTDTIELRVSDGAEAQPPVPTPTPPPTSTVYPVYLPIIMR